MRTTKTAFFLFGATAFASVIAACSASSVGVEDEGNLPAEEEDAAADTGKKDAGKDTGPSRPDATTNTDSGNKPDAVADAKPDNTVVPEAGSDAADAAVDAPADVIAADASLPPVGAACATANEIQTQACGMCGTQSRVCKADADGGLVWHAWGFCQNEVVGGCVPGTTVNEPCGMCGTMTRLCQADCRYANQACTGQPANACKPGDVEFKVGLSCDAGGRSRVCENTCTWGNFGQCTEPVNNHTLAASPVVGTIVSSPETLGSRWEMTLDTKLLAGSNSTCPLTTLSSGNRKSHYAEVKNTTAAPIKVSVFHDDRYFTGSSTDTIMAVYPGKIAPPDNDDNARKQCLAGTSAKDDCPASLAGAPPSCDDPNGSAFSVAGIDNITIPPNSSIMVFSQFWSSSGSGAYVLKVKTVP
jgi:hypothetical protein